MPRVTPRGWGDGWIEFPDAVTKIDFRRAIDGVIWPIKLQLNFPRSSVPPLRGKEDDEMLVAHDFRVELRTTSAQGGTVPIAESYLTDHWKLRPGWSEPWFEIPISSTALARIEVQRNGTGPRFDLVMHGGIMRTGRYFVPGTDDCPHPVIGSLPFGVSVEVWIEALSTAGVSQNVVVEVPLGSPARPEFQAARKALAEAVAEFQRGGAGAWRACAGAVRQALDAWPGFQPGQPIVQLNRAWTKEERFIALREVVRHATHPAHHGLAEDWDRQSAMTLLAATAALLSRENG